MTFVVEKLVKASISIGVEIVMTHLGDAPVKKPFTSLP
jgi:hypothetical protein